MIAMYHGTKLGNMVATSSDPLLLNWEKITDGAPISMYPGTDGKPLPYRVFDPCIWKKDDMYYALSGGQLSRGPGGKFTRANWLFRSENLADWEYLHPVSNPISTRGFRLGQLPWSRSWTVALRVISGIFITQIS